MCLCVSLFVCVCVCVSVCLSVCECVFDLKNATTPVGVIEGLRRGEKVTLVLHSSALT